MTSFSFDDEDAAFSALSLSASGGGRLPTSTRSGISALSGESEDFRTAQSTASTVTGGESISGTKSVVPLLFVENPEIICKAIIGSTDGINRFCTKLCSECTIQRHFDDDGDNPTVERATVPEGAILIVPRKGQALEKPVVLRAWFQDDEFARLMDMKKKIVVWFDWFGLRTAESQAREDAKGGGLMDEDEEGEWEEVSSSPRISVETVEEGHEDLLSPKSAGLEKVAANLPETVEVKKEGMLLQPTRLVSLENYLVENGAEGLSPELLASLNEIVKDWAKIQANFETIASHLSDQSKLQALFKRSMEETLRLTDDKFKVLDTKAGLLFASIGRNTKSANEGELSVWSAIRGLQLEMKGLGGSLDKLEQALLAESAKRAEEIDALQDSMPSVSGDWEEQLRTFRDQYSNRMSTLHHILTSLTSRISALESGPTLGPYSATYQGRPYDEVLAELERGLKDFEQAFPKSELQRLQVELQSLQAQVQQFVNGTPGGVSQPSPSRHGATPASPGLSWNQLAANAGMRGSTAGVTWAPGHGVHVTPPAVMNPYHDIPDLIPQFKDLSAQVKQLSERNGSSSCDFGRWVFNSERDVSSFLERTNMEIGWAVDLFTALVAMVSGKRTGRSLADDFWSASRIGSTNLRNNLLAAMSSDRPACLFGDDGNGKAKSMTEGMARVKSHTDWAATAEPYRNTLERDLSGFLLGVNGAMPAEESVRDPNELEGIQFAKHLIMLVKSHWSALIGFIDSSYIELRFRAHFTEKMSWVLVGRFAATVFNEMLPFRSSAKLLNDPTTLMARTSVLWAVLQCHRVMQEFIQLRFNGHTAIVREMSFFMLTDRVSSEDVADIKRKLEESEKHGAATTKRLKQTEDRLDKVEAKCAELKSEISALSNTFKQFKSNEGKGKK